MHIEPMHNVCQFIVILSADLGQGVSLTLGIPSPVLRLDVSFYSDSVAFLILDWIWDRYNNEAHRTLMYFSSFPNGFLYIVRVLTTSNSLNPHQKSKCQPRYFLLNFRFHAFGGILSVGLWAYSLTQLKSFGDLIGFKILCWPPFVQNNI